MSDTRFDVLTIGNAIIDVLASCDEDFLVSNDIIKGAMNLIDAQRSAQLFAAMGPARIISGGSAANTAVGVAALGGTAAYFGKVSNDDNGRLYTHDIRQQGVHFESAPLGGPPPTATSMIFVTPDGERSMNTYLGACVELAPEDIEEDVVRGSQVTYFEGYLWDPPRAKDAIRLACDLAHSAGQKTAMSLSDTFCVDRFRPEFKELLTSKTVDIVFANEAEAKALYQTEDLTTALDSLVADCELAIVTLGAEGSIAVSREQRVQCTAYPPKIVKDTTGAGDMFAAGFLYGFTNGLDLETSGRLANFAASNVIEDVGARPFNDLKAAAQQAGIIG